MCCICETRYQPKKKLQLQLTQENVGCDDSPKICELQQTYIPT